MPDPVSREDVVAELARIEASKDFQDSARLVALLRFLVEETLLGHGSQLKEVVIGNALYEREPAYDPRIDSTVRVEMRRLRRKLIDYFAGEGQADPVEIAVPTGQYAAIFTHRAAPLVTVAEEPAGAPLFEAGQGATAAVLPFLALSRDPAEQDLADRLTDEITFILSQWEGLRMAPRGAVLRYRESANTGKAAAAELGVDAVLHGSLRRHGDILRVIAELSDEQGYVLWSDRFDTPDADQLQLLERIARTLTSRLGIDSSQVRARTMRPRPGAVQVMATISQGRRLMDSQRPDALHRAMALFERIARSAPDVARGHTGVADCACDLYRLGLLDRATAARVARDAAQRALRIDPASAEAHAAFGTIAAWIDFDRAGAEVWFARAAQLGETARAARIRGVALLLLQREPEGAARQLRIARTLEPISAHQDIAEAISLFQGRQFTALAERFGRAPRVPAAAEARYYGALALLETGAPQAAREVIAEIADELADLPDLALGVSEIAARLGDPAPAARAAVPGRPVSHFARATLAMALGRHAEAIEALAACVAREDLSRAWLRTDRRFDPLRGMPAFEALAAAVRDAAS
ncbi:TPR end-of-group domain-containing protein [Roseomonas sp. F4]